MRTDSRLSRMLHVLLHMACAEGPLTSEQIAAMLGTNAVVVRRTMAGLRDRGYVLSDKGHGGGWRLACNLRDVSLLDIHEAVGGPNLFAIGNHADNPNCAVEKAVNAALSDALEAAEAILLKRLADTSLAELAEDFGTICRKDRKSTA
jgi:DNA-binding IscR family transcriptional regulator